MLYQRSAFCCSSNFRCAQAVGCSDDNRPAAGTDRPTFTGPYAALLARRLKSAASKRLLLLSTPRKDAGWRRSVDATTAGSVVETKVLPPSYAGGTTDVLGYQPTVAYVCVSR